MDALYDNKIPLLQLDLICAELASVIESGADLDTQVGMVEYTLKDTGHTIDSFFRMCNPNCTSCAPIKGYLEQQMRDKTEYDFSRS